MKPLPEKHVFGIPDLAIILTTACWGLNFVITKSATGNSPEQFRIFVYNIIRFPVASALLFITIKLKGQNPFIERRYLAAVAGLSFIGIFMYQILYMVGQTMTSSANIGIIYGFTPLLILLVSVIAGVEKPSIITVIGVLLGCTGLVVILFKGGKLSLDTGALLFLCGLLCWACYTVLGKRVLEKIPPVITTAWVLFFGTVYQLPLALWQLPHQSWGKLSGRNILFVILAALLSLYTGYTLFYYAVSRMGPVKAGVYSNLTPVFTLFFAVLIRGEKIFPVQILGLAIIITGIGITKISPVKKHV